MRVLFLVRSLDLGGAERQLVALSRGLRQRGHDVSIAVFYAGGRFEPELRTHGVPVHDLRKTGRWETVTFLARLARLVRRVRPDVLHAYMEANVFAAALKPLFPSTKVVWGIRSAKSDMRKYGRVAMLYPWLERLLAPLPDAIIVNSSAARQRAIANGLGAAKIAIVPNGIDCELFRPDPAGGAELRARWNIPRATPAMLLVGMVARLDPVKNHPNFLRAAARVAATRPDVRFVCIADAKARPGYREELAALAATLKISDRLAWVDDGRVSGPVYSALDVVVLSSDVGESFPNVLGEAMACGKLAVTTDSGDAASIVGDPAAVAPPGDDVALARCILSALARATPGNTFLDGQRARVTKRYSLEMLAIRTESTLDGIRRGGPNAAPGVVAVPEAIVAEAASNADGETNDAPRTEDDR